MNLAHFRHIHFIGIGGAGVSGLARIALEGGCTVSGSDQKDAESLTVLKTLGARIVVGHRRENLPDETALVVATAAVRPSNPEYQEAVRRRIRVLKYAEALGEITRRRTNLCVAGTHGKTTSTAMLAAIMHRGGKSPGWLVGGEPLDLPSHSAMGGGIHFVMESCEYDRSFLNLTPTLVLLTNIEADHLDCYGSIEKIEESFGLFADRTRNGGALVYNADDPRCARIARNARCTTIGFGESRDAAWRLERVDASTGFVAADVTCRGMRVGRMALRVPGRVNAVNALGAVAAANWAGVHASQALSVVNEFRGVRRRFEVLGVPGGVPLVDDYAHHPTAVRQLLETARRVYPQRRLLAVFQAHQYARLLQFFDDFTDALSLADRVLIARTFAARERNIAVGEPEERLARALRERGVEAISFAEFGGILYDLTLKTAPNDAVFFIGAGDVNEIGFELMHRRGFVSTRLKSIPPASQRTGAAS